MGRINFTTTTPVAGGATPPLPPFTRIPTSVQKLSEHNDAIFDDGVAPEVALDFDCQHISKTEGGLTWLGALTCYVLLYQAVKFSDPESKNPAVNRKMNMVIENPRTGPPVLS